MWHSNSSFAGRKEKHAFFNGNKIRYILFYILKKTASSFCALWNWQRANMLCIYFPHSYIRNLGKPENREELLQYLMWPNIKISATWYHGSTPFTAEPWRARFFFLNQGVHYFLTDFPYWFAWLSRDAYSPSRQQYFIFLVFLSV